MKHLNRVVFVRVFLPKRKTKGVHAMKKRSLKQLKAWARLAAENELLVSVASSANSPNHAYELAYIETGDADLAKSCRWLAMIKRDYSKSDFENYVSSVTSKRPRKPSTGKEKGARTMAETNVKARVSESEVAPSIPLKHIDYRTSLNGTFARVRCIQEFENNAQAPVEAVYVFPLPDDASVTKCSMQIGERKVEAEIKKREEARKEYEDAVSQGHHGALLEQERPNIFTMNVGGIEPGEKISVDVDYVQRVPWQAGGGRFRIPLVVAPQFIPGEPTGQQAGGWSPDTDEVPDASRITPKVAPAGVPYDANISILFSPGFRSKVNCPSHPFICDDMTVGKTETVELKTGDIRTDRDFTLVYTSVSKVPEIAIHSGKTDGESFRLASIIPPGEAVAVPSDIVLVLDCSGSMSGASISGLKVVAKKVVKNIREQNQGHRIGIVPFDSAPRQEFPIGEVTETTDNFIDGLEADGGTKLGLALGKAENMLRAQDPTRNKVMLMVTDGDTEHGKNWYGNGVRLIGVGIGVAVNDSRIVELTKRNLGVADFVYPGEDYGAVAGRLSGYLSGPVLRDVSVDCDGEVVGVADVFKGRPATIAVKFPSKAAGAIKITGKTPDGSDASWEVKKASKTKACDFAPQIWARDFIRENPTEKERQIEVSLKYGVICQHTSFVAVSLKEVPGQKPVRVEVPVNLPDGWDYEKVFGQAFHLSAQTSHFIGTLGLRSRGGGTKRLLGSRSPELFSLGVGPTKGGPDIEELTMGIDVDDIQITTPTRFKLDASDPVDRLVAILNAVLKNNRKGAESAFARLTSEFTAQKAEQLSEEKKSMAYYFALRLAKHGLKLDKAVTDKLSAEPVAGSPARAWYNLALKEQGRTFDSWVPDNYEASGYLKWKFGAGYRPLIGEWSEVL